MKILILIFLCWSKFIVYDPIVIKTTEEWMENDSIPPRFSERTKQLMRKQKWAKIWTILLSIIPLGPISMIATVLLLHGKFGRGTLIKDELKKQSDRVENFKEELRQSKRKLINSIEKSINKDKKFDWRQVIIPGSPEDMKIRELMLQLESMGIFNTSPKDSRYEDKYKDYLKSKENKGMEIPLLENELAYEAYGTAIPQPDDQEFISKNTVQEEEVPDDLPEELDPSEYEGEEYEYDEDYYNETRKD